MNVLIRKHLCFERTGKYMVLISPSDIFTDSFISFQMKTTFSNVTYIFLDNIAIDIIQPLRIILIILAAVFRTKMGILLTEDVLSFSLCESYLSKQIEISNNHLFEMQKWIGVQKRDLLRLRSYDGNDRCLKKVFVLEILIPCWCGIRLKNCFTTIEI